MGERKTYKIHPGVSITTDQEPVRVEDWLEEGKRLFGEDVQKWRFQCPMCGKIYSMKEFLDAGGEMNGAYVECIGRHLGAGSPGSADGNPNGCNWAAYGLFGIPNNKGRLILTPDGKVTEVFDFAKEEKTA